MIDDHFLSTATLPVAVFFCTFVSVMSDLKLHSDRWCLGIDIGGTGIKAAPVDTERGGLLAEPLSLDTQPSDPDHICAALGKIVANFDWHGPIGCGYPGVVKNGVALTAVHLSKEWLNLNIAQTFGRAVGRRVTVLNDADAAGLAELRFGAAKEYGRSGRGVVLALTFGTGIGSALFSDGRLVPNTEFGHLFVEFVEAEELAAASIRTRDGLSWSEWGMRVNRYLAEMEKLLSPDLIVIGGGVSENFRLFEPFLRTRAQLAPAVFGNNAGIVGAALAASELR